MNYELILTEQDLKNRNFEIPIDLKVKLTKQDIEHLKETKKMDYLDEVLIKIKLECKK